MTTFRISTLRAGAALLALAFSAGCATTQVTPTMQYTGALPRPQRILVYRFASNPEEVQLDNSPTVMASWRAAGTTASSEQQQVAISVADAVADNLVTEIQALGMPAQRAAGPPPEDGIPTLAITGQFMAIDEGSRALRMTIGLGAGQSSVISNVQVFNVFPAGRRMVDAFEVTAQSGRKPGAAETMGAGAAAGTLATAAVVTGASSVASEAFGANVDDDAKRTAKKIASMLSNFFAQQGWTGP